MSNWTKPIKSLCTTDQNQSNQCVQLNKTNKITVYNWTKPIKSLCTTEQTNQITVYNWTKPIKSLCTTEQNQSNHFVQLNKTNQITLYNWTKPIRGYPWGSNTICIVRDHTVQVHWGITYEKEKWNGLISDLWHIT